ncbi:hypothetical protein SUGI_0268170 [Cryptomeria japonica]|uniref:uncharacterized protein LOC131059751 n=1 Tax=Cryptomeria japonica TaxID=3369 RepID=UPI002408D716|nr:uncharacterized protein LOC131059751 [Cryptomeria japonica]GLJ16093.1 hypothetical protein SUGI_0268170 [Cryptomeria japonica]
MGSEGRKEERASERMKKKDSVGTRIELRCTAIQMFLLESTSGSEKRIREMFGDNPDTSKALRMLLKNHRVRRFGSGGRSDPFVYMALTPPSMNELERLKEANVTETM